jgi:transposase-like protein
MAAATLKQRRAAAAVLRDGGSYAQAAAAAGVSRRTVIRWKDDLPEPPPDVPSSRAVLEGLLYSDNERIRLDAAYRLEMLRAEEPEPTEDEYDTMIFHDCQPGEERTELHVFRVRPAGR